MATWRATITIMDNKRRLGKTGVWLNGVDSPEPEFSYPYEYLRDWYIGALDAIITGQIVNVSLALNVPIGDLGLKNAPFNISDRENGALFGWGRSTGYSRVLQSIPTFDEQFIIEGTDLVDLSSVAVQHFITVSILATELPSGGYNIGVNDNRGLGMNRLEFAREQFKHG